MQEPTRARPSRCLETEPAATTQLVGVWFLDTRNLSHCAIGVNDEPSIGVSEETSGETNPRHFPGRRLHASFVAKRISPQAIQFPDSKYHS